MPLKLAPSFSFFGGRDSSSYDGKKADGFGKRERLPVFRLQVDKEVYRPGDSITTTIEICSPEISNGAHQGEPPRGSTFMLDSLSFEIKGIEKLDTQWFATQKPLPGSKEKRDSVRAELPKILPPSYRGTTVRYMYYVRSTICGRWLVLENGHHDREPVNDLIQLEARQPLQIWGTQKSSSIFSEENQVDGIAPATPAQMDIYWKEKNVDSEWVRAIDTLDGFEEGYDSSRDEISSVSSYNPTKGNIDLALRTSLSMQSIASRLSTHEVRHSQGESSNMHYMTLSQLSVSEVADDANTVPSLSQRRRFSDSPFSKDELKAHQGPIEPGASEGFIRGRSYNIRIDDEVLLRFSPKNSDSTYYFGDMIGGTLTFFHGGARRCLEVSITLETSETISQRFVHPSRRSSPTITKVQSDHHAVVADLTETNFLFSIPMDGPMSFSTPYVSLQWALRFEFFTTPKGVDWSRYEHPLFVEERERGDWVLPITVHALPPHSQAAHRKNQKPFPVGNLWVRT
ncbi:hypothetical protein Taro_019741 [Colocasia esculenta]|uniref:Reduced growth phenotype protein 1 n=1 Tax=Colocasia esculenta TaxID=4460 RepID=A0A843UUJ7_COLES|nr:hypothetical protein [Colocasia esculenta]